MVRTKDADGIKSNLIISEVQKRPCLYDMNHPHYGDRAEKAKSWEEVCATVVPGWTMLGLEHKFSAGKEVQKRWRSIRDSFTKAFRQGKCLLPEQCAPGSRRLQYHRQMSFLLRALKNKKPRLSREFEVLSEISSSPHHKSEEITPKLFLDKIEKNEKLPKLETTDKTRAKKDRENTEQLTPMTTEQLLPKFTEQLLPKTTEHVTKSTEPTKITEEIMVHLIEKPEALKKRLENLGKIKSNISDAPPPVEKINNSNVDVKDSGTSISPDDYFEDDKLFMNSLLPSLKKMDDDTRLLCRIEILKIIRYALQGRKTFDGPRDTDICRFNSHSRKEECSNEVGNNNRGNAESTLSMTTRSADGSRPVRKKRCASPYTPYSTPPVKKRGPGRPRKVRPPTSDTDEESSRRRCKMRSLPTLEPRLSECDDELYRATSVAQLNTPCFMKMYNLERSKNAAADSRTAHNMEISVKREPMDTNNELT